MTVSFVKRELAPSLRPNDLGPCFSNGIWAELLNSPLADQIRSDELPLRRLRRGDRIGGSGEHCFCLSLVRSGLLATARRLSNGRRQLVSLHQAGDAICSVTAAKQPFDAVALAGSEISTLVLKPEGKDPRVTEILFRLVHAEMLKLSNRTVLLGRMTAMERVLSFLNELVDHHGATTEAGVHVDLDMTREDIADYLGLKAETVSRLFSKVRKTGLIVFDGPARFDVPDPGALRAIDPENPLTA